jgi:WD40 repeat protein/serine/threonine protein kinase
MASPNGVRRIRERYDVVEIVGRGGQGTVVKAFDTRHDRFVALKIRRSTNDLPDSERQLGEVRTLLELSPHPGLPLVRDDFFERDQHILVLDWVDGVDLGRVLATDGAPGLPPSTVLRWAAQAAEALTHLHRHDPPIVHGDIKPANLVLDRHGRIVCVDFGVSSVPGRVQRGGTPGYRAPEVTTGETPTPAADVYGLAATVFALLTGAPPSGLLPSWTGIETQRAERLEAALRHGLATDPARRPATVGELVELMRIGEPDTLPTGTVTVLATNVVDSATLWAANPRVMPGVLARHDLIVDRIVDQHGGRRLGDTVSGDATESVFTRAAQAVAAAVALNRDLVGACDPPIQVRAGIHTGGIDGPGAQGPTVNRAAHIRDLAGSGQVLLSSTTARLVGPEQLNGILLVPLGEHRLAGAAAPEEIVAVAAAGLDVPPDPTIPPYPGLIPFSPNDADVYFGRDEAVASLRQLLQPGRVVAVLGASGSGKSSLLSAGLLPHLSGCTMWTPGAHPLTALDIAGAGVLIVDQLEELITLSDAREEQQEFVDRLCAHPAGAVVGLRADALAALARFPLLADSVAAHHVLLAPMRPDQLRLAIEAPALRRGLTLEPGLVDLVLADAGDELGALPLIAHAMRETWLSREGRTLTVAGYRHAGGVHGAVSATAEAVFASLDDADRELLRVVLMRMVQPGDGTADSRRRVDLSELRDLGGRESTERLIAQLTAARLVTVDGASVQPAHEALLRAWPRLADWISEQRDDLRRHRHLTTASQTWARNDSDPAELYRGGRLDGAVELSHRSPLTATEQSFVDASAEAGEEDLRRTTATNRRLRRLVGGVATALVVAVLAAALSIVQLTRASNQRRRADAASVSADIARLGAEARAVMGSQPDLALLLTLEANRRRDTIETRGPLLEALTAHPQLVAKLHGVDSGLWSVAWSDDGTKLAVTTSDSTGTIVWDAGTYQPIGQPLATGEEFQIDFDAEFTTDGRTLVVAGLVEHRTPGAESFEPALQIWDVTTHALNATVPLVVLPEAVIALGDEQALVAGRPVPRVWTGEEPEWAAAIQVVDIHSGVAGPLETVATEPLAAAIVGTSLLVISNDYKLTITDYGRATRPSSATIDLNTVLDHGDPPTLMGYDPGGRRLAVAGASGSVVLAELGNDTATLIRRLDTYGEFPSALAFSPDGALLAVGGFLGSTRLFVGATGVPAGPPLAGLAGEVRDLSFNSDGSRLAVAGLDGTGSVWRLDGSRSIGRPIEGHTDGVVATMPLPDGDTVLTASFDGSVIARNVDNGTVRWVVDTGEPIWTAVLDPTGTRVAVGGADGQLEVLDAANGATVSGPVRFPSPVEALAWSPVSPLLAVGADRADDRFTHELVFVNTSTLEPDGAGVTTVGGTTTNLAFSPDGARLAAVIDNNVVRVIDVATRSLEPDYLESVDVPFFSVAWAPDGDRIATGTVGGTVQLWDATTLQPTAPAGQASPLPIRGLTFSPDGTMLAATTEFATSRLWNVDSGAPVGGDLVGGELPITVASIPGPDRPEIPFVPGFSPDGLFLYAGGDEPMVWSLNPADWRIAACTVAGRDLTSAEWGQFLPAQSTRPICSTG